MKKIKINSPTNKIFSFFILAILILIITEILFWNHLHFFLSFEEYNSVDFYDRSLTWQCWLTFTLGEIAFATILLIIFFFYIPNKIFENIGCMTVGFPVIFLLLFEIGHAVIYHESLDYLENKTIMYFQNNQSNLLIQKNKLKIQNIKFDEWDEEYKIELISNNNYSLPINKIYIYGKDNLAKNLHKKDSMNIMTDKSNKKLFVYYINNIDDLKNKY